VASTIFAISHRVVDGGAALDQLVAADAHTEREAVADHLAHGGHDLGEQAGAVDERAAVLVGAPVGGGRQEAAHDRRVAALQFDAVEAALGAVLGDERVAGDDLLDLGVVTAFGTSRNSGSATADGRPHGQAREHRRRLAAVVVDLGEDRHPVAVHRVGDGRR
jgi:hypothetical protein